MIIEQILVTQMVVFCYLVGDPVSGEAALIDPGGELDKIFKVVEKHKLKVRWVINTHGHGDHTGGNRGALERTGATLVVHQADAQMLDRSLVEKPGSGKGPGSIRFVKDGDEIEIGKHKLKVLATPGHTKGGICLLLDDKLFTGDTLFTEGVGRTDLPGGSGKELMNSIRTKILSLPDETRIYPGHHYGTHRTSTVKEQKRYF
jgi:glyoxylase-like metal-dependent hydrolase (beta-lactamase superfamily II)